MEYTKRSVIIFSLFVSGSDLWVKGAYSELLQKGQSVVNTSDYLEPA